MTTDNDNYNLDQINPILNLKAAEKLQNFQVSKIDRENYGIIYTPFSLIKNIFDLLPSTIFENPNNRWLDMGAGTGYFSIYLYHQLFQSLQNKIPNPTQRKKHIIKNMIYMAEIKDEHIESLKNIFGNNANIISTNFLSIKKDQYSDFNIIIGNPPYNSNGQIKTPTNQKIEKTGDGITIWPDFIKKAVELLVPQNTQTQTQDNSDTRFLLAITPAIWLKPDKAGIYKLLINHIESSLSTQSTKLKLLKLHTLSASETNKIFHYQAQTPTSYFLGGTHPLPHHQGKYAYGIGKNDQHHIDIYDNSLKKYIEYPIYRENIPIPISSISIIKKLIPYISKIGHIKVYKTNMPPSKSKFSLSPSVEYPYKNVKTCIFGSKNPTQKNIPSPIEMVYEYSNIPQSYSIQPNHQHQHQHQHQPQPKLILAHKMYGFPFLDETGELGISYRDNYVIIDKSLQDLKTLQKFLSTKLIQSIYDATRYRMRYLEKYAFELIPDITKLNNFPTDINDQSIADYFNISQEEREIINKYPDYNI
jgi:methylase of polypeptide subunit release factors